MCGGSNESGGCAMSKHECTDVSHLQQQVRENYTSRKCLHIRTSTARKSSLSMWPCLVPPGVGVTLLAWTTCKTRGANTSAYQCDYHIWCEDISCNIAHAPPYPYQRAFFALLLQAMSFLLPSPFLWPPLGWKTGRSSGTSSHCLTLP